jgi:Fe-S-cluster containining protein
MDRLEKKQTLLSYLTRAFDAYVDGMHPVVCKPGCASCCTEHVTVTTLEAHRVYARLTEAATGSADPFPPAGPGPFRPTYTTNDFAAACFEHRELPEESPGPTLSPCPFLSNDRCSLYDARPFACRSFLSLENCRQAGQAEIPSALASVIGVCQQIIEHIDVGGYYGNLSDMLHALAKDSAAEAYANGENMGSVPMPNTRSLPGFLIPPEDQQEVSAFLSRLFSIKIDGVPFLEVCSDLRPLPFDKD